MLIKAWCGFPGKVRLYEVYHSDGIGCPPKFETWEKAFAAQKEWNKEVPGHKARKRKV